MDPEAFVAVAPSRKGGAPTVNGTRLPTHSVATAIAQGWGVDTYADDFDLTPEQVLVACWYEAENGTRKFRTEWREWASEWVRTLGGWDDREVPDPPAFWAA